MNAKHTQGPWRVVDLSQEAHELAVMDTDKDRIGLFAAIRLESSKPTNEDFANARLIAAAPEMLAALKSFVNGVEAATKRNDPVVERLQFHYHRAKAVISKAEGTE